MKKVTGALLTLLVVCSNLYVQASETKSRKVPIVVYTPYNFQDVISDAFECGSTQDYYIITSDGIYRYSRRESENGSVNKRELRRYTKHKNISKFRNDILNNDSCFFFALSPLKVYDDNILGIINHNQLSFIDVNGKKYGSLTDLISYKVPRGGVPAFFDDCIDRYKNALYNNGTDNGFYDIASEDEAIKILRRDYNFQYYANRSDTLAVITNFVNLLDRFIVISSEQKCKLQEQLFEGLESSSPNSSFNQIFHEYLYGKSFDFIPLLLQDVSSLLKNNLPEDQYLLFLKKYKIYRNKVNAAYRFLFDKYFYEITDGTIPFMGRVKYDQYIETLTDKFLR